MCPISTTVDVNVAQRFATKKGMLLALKPDTNAIDRYMDVSWLSAFPEEQERLFYQTFTLYIADVRWNESSANISWGNSHLI